MGVKLGDAIVYFRGDSSNLDKELGNAENKTRNWSQSIGSTVQKAGAFAMAGIGAAAVGVISIASKAIPAASDLNESLNASSVVFGEAADQIQAFGKTSAEAIGLSEAAFNQLAAQTGAMLQNYGLNADEAASATIDLGQRAADMASIFNTDVSEAMTAINAAMRGEADPIERFGVSMNMASVEAKALAMGFEKVDGQFDAAALTQARLALLMDQTNSIAGDFANTSDQLANATRVNDARWEDFMANLGKVGLPIMTTVQSILMNVGDKVFPLVENAISSVMPFVDQISSALGGFVDMLLNGDSIFRAFNYTLLDTFGRDNVGGIVKIVSNLSIAFDALKVAVGALDAGIIDFGDLNEFQTTLINIGSAINRVISPIIDWISENVSLNDVLTGLAVAIGAVVMPAIISVLTTIAPIVAAFAAITLGVALLRKAWETDFGGIRTTLTEFWTNSAQPAFEQIKEWFQRIMPPIIEKFRSIWTDSLQPAFQELGRIWREEVAPLFDGEPIITLEGFLSGLEDTINFVVDAIALLAAGFLGAVNGIQGFIDWVKSTIDWLKTTKDNAVSTGNSIKGSINKAWQSVVSFWDGTVQPKLDAARAFIDENIIPILKALGNVINAIVTLGLRVMAGVWQNLLLPALQGVWAFIDKSILPVFETVAKFISTQFNAAVESLTNIWNNDLLPALQKVSDYIDKHVKPVLETIADVVQNVVGSAFMWFKNTLLDPLSGSLNSVKLNIQGVVDWLNNLANNINSLSLPDWLTPGSPTPFELGLRGISSALKDVSGLALPQMQAGFGGLSAAGVGASGGSSSVVIQSLTFQLQNAPRNEREAKESADLLRDELRRRGL